jgi:hypothetical protein
LELLCKTIRRIVLDGLVSVFASEKQWKALLAMPYA